MMLRFVRKISVWYFRTHHNSNIKIGPFSPPIATPDTDSDSKAEIERLKTLYEQETAANKKLQEQAADEAELRELAEKERRPHHLSSNIVRFNFTIESCTQWRHCAMLGCVQLRG